jgi:hypothetical protein
MMLMSTTLKRLFQIWKRHNVDSGQAWGVGLICEKSIYLPIGKPNNLIVYNAGDRLDICDRDRWTGMRKQLNKNIDTKNFSCPQAFLSNSVLFKNL